MSIIKDDYKESFWKIASEIEKEIEKIENAKNVKEKINEIKKKIETLKSGFLSKKGIIASLLNQLSKLDQQQRKELGKEINEFKQEIESFVKSITEKIEEKEKELKYYTNLDLSVNYTFKEKGHFHILTIVQEELMNVFAELGFEIIDGIEIEDEYHNFEALNIPSDHPARDMWDTFYLQNGILRTHTSNMQIRILEKRKPPIKAISIGKCYRRDNMDATHSFQFHQLEGFSIDEGISFLDLIRTLYKFVGKYFGVNSKVNFVPSYFPFTEPSAEMSVSCFACNQQNSQCSVCKGTGWIEILGCGMINPVVLRNVGIDYEKFSGFAFGMGIERIAMLKYKIPDIRMFFENYLEFNSLWG